MFRAQDPYVKATVLPSGESRQCLPALSAGKSPEWDQSHNNDLAFRVSPEAVSLSHLSVKIEVWNANTLMDDLVAVAAEVARGRDVASLEEKSG